MHANKSVASGGAPTPYPADDAKNRTTLQERADSPMTIPNPMLALNMVALMLGATVAEVMDAANITYVHAVRMARQAEIAADHFAHVPMIPQVDVDLIRMNLERDRAELAAANPPEGVLLDPIPTVEQNLTTLEHEADWEDGDNFLLAEVTRGVFTAQVWRHDCLERGRPHSEPLEITIDSTGMQGGEMFHDLCLFPDQLDDYRQVTTAIFAAYEYIVGQVK